VEITQFVISEPGTFHVILTVVGPVPWGPSWTPKIYPRARSGSGRARAHGNLEFRCVVPIEIRAVFLEQKLSGPYPGNRPQDGATGLVIHAVESHSPFGGAVLPKPSTRTLVPGTRSGGWRRSSRFSRARAHQPPKGAAALVIRPCQWPPNRGEWLGRAYADGPRQRQPGVGEPARNPVSKPVSYHPGEASVRRAGTPVRSGGTTGEACPVQGTASRGFHAGYTPRRGQLRLR